MASLVHSFKNFIVGFLTMQPGITVDKKHICVVEVLEDVLISLEEVLEEQWLADKQRKHTLRAFILVFGIACWH